MQQTASNMRARRMFHADFLSAATNVAAIHFFSLLLLLLAFLFLLCWFVCRWFWDKVKSHRLVHCKSVGCLLWPIAFVCSSLFFTYLGLSQFTLRRTSFPIALPNYGSYWIYISRMHSSLEITLRVVSRGFGSGYKFIVNETEQRVSTQKKEHISQRSSASVCYENNICARLSEPRQTEKRKCIEARTVSA